ncbi:MAG TPA: radical SAM protein, partial [Thermoanaerobaculia bacterium]|nr:radical SAM protein [Thermoanaerobaculia bacterium]
MNVAQSGAEHPSPVYGPVDSWRFGRSIGIDPLLVDSICSFRCVYCQLGRINRPTRTRGIWVRTATVISALQQHDLTDVEAVTFSGSGEPTLAANLGEMVHAVREQTRKPVVVLTNSSLLDLPEVRRELLAADQVSCKLDAFDEHVLSRINRPVENISLQSILHGIERFRQQYDGILSIQVMLLPANLLHLERLGTLIQTLGADQIHLTLPLRTIPGEWSLLARGDHRPEPAPAALRISPRVIEDAARRLEARCGTVVRYPWRFRKD